MQLPCFQKYNVFILFVEAKSLAFFKIEFFFQILANLWIGNTLTIVIDPSSMFFLDLFILF